ncbi:flagellar hook-length control protein FliK [Ciceribacter sp. L1K23]|uniref:flagellar hook-length control protein FliK n=1 Tax=Ciceribacter sp. L1K23 TaxID=2820276 RepID=UPI001B80F3DD|nr:flagellar hook-length control protein FliK [Ciceribacter sp. L1K23]MBR0556991.1 flagellar hook-length control protein FliK [Ciceribacter sp. L1K23]
MIDPSIAPKVHANDGASYASGKTGKSAEPGFSHALSGAEQQDQNSSRQTPGGDADAAATGTTQADGQEGTQSSRKPIIDLRAAAAIRGMEASGQHGRHNRHASDDSRVGQDEKTGEAKSKTDKAAVRKTAKDALEDVASGDDLTTDKAQSPATDELNVDAAQAGATANPLEEVFSLLAAAGEVAGQANAGVKSNTGKTRSQDGEASRTASVDAAEKGNDDDIDVAALLADGQSAEDTADMRDDGGASFRAVRADGKGQPLILQTAEASADAGTSGNADSTPTVAVLESRRYIAPVSTSNAANIAAAMSGDRDWVSALQAGSDLTGVGTHAAAGKVMNTLKIQMSPIELGNVTATLRLHGETLSVHLTVENGAAYRKLNEDNNEIMKTLRAQGYAVDSIQISIASTDRSSSDTSQQNGQQSSGQAPQGDGRQQASSNGGGGDRSQSFSSSFDNQGSGNEDISAARTVADNGNNRAGGVYL